MQHVDTPLIQLEDVHFGYGERPVLEGVSLQVPKGKVTALMGASGRQNHGVAPDWRTVPRQQRASVV